jgi:uncharacterized repeat protein (TIGR01451 family)
MSHEAADRVRRTDARTLAALLLLALSVRAMAQAPVGADLLVTAGDAGNTYVAGSDVTYTVTVSNRGTQAVRDVAISGELPQDISVARWTCATAPGVTCGAANGTGALNDRVSLDPGATATYRVTLAVPANHASGALTYQVNATLPQGYASTAPGDLTASDTNTRAPAGTAGSGIIAPRTDVRAGRPLTPDSGGLLGQRAPRGPFACSTDMFISQGANNNTATTLYRVDTSQTPFVMQTIGINQNGFAYNAMGYNPADNFLYAIRVRTNVVFRIHADGTTERVGDVAGLPSLSGADGDTYNAGDIGTDGYMYVKRQGSRNTIYRIDLGALRATAISLSAAVDGADLAWIADATNPTSGMLYTMNTNGILSRIDPATGQVAHLPISNNALFGGNANIGALFGSSSGLFGSRNNPSEYYQFDLTTGLASKVSTGDRVVSVNDGAHCASAPVDLGADLSVTKTNTPAQGPNDLPTDTYAPGAAVTYTIVVSNAGPSDVHNVPVQDPLPAGITTARWTCTATGTGACGAPSGTGALSDLVSLGAGDAATYLFTIDVPANYAQSHAALTNTVTVTLPDGFTDPTPDDLTATDTDTAAADLSVVKATPSQSTIVGETLAYTITVGNAGTADVLNAVLKDTADARLDCPAVSDTATCNAFNGAACPGATVPVADLLGAGVTIPAPPSGSRVVFALSCRIIE